MTLTITAVAKGTLFNLRIRLGTDLEGLVGIPLEAQRAFLTDIDAAQNTRPKPRLVAGAQ